MRFLPKASPSVVSVHAGVARDREAARGGGGYAAGHRAGECRVKEERSLAPCCPRRAADVCHVCARGESQEYTRPQSLVAAARKYRRIREELEKVRIGSVHCPQHPLPQAVLMWSAGLAEGGGGE
jgi:hypothetical protein